MDRAAYTILVVEDETLSRMLLEEFVRSGEFSVLSASGGADALAKLDKFRFSVMVTDIAMPGQLDGNGLAEAALGFIPDLKIVFVTGLPDSVAPALAARWPVLTKPVDPDDLTRAIVKLLDHDDFGSKRPEI